LITNIIILNLIFKKLKLKAMKTKKYSSIKRASFLVIALLTFFSTAGNLISCPYCNAKFYEELFTTRSNSLISEELLKSITNLTNNTNSVNYPSLTPLTNYTSNVKNEAAGYQQQGNPDFIEIISRDNSLSIPPTSYVPQNVTPDKKVSVELSEGEVYIGNGVMYKGFVMNGTIPGPTILLDEGDIVEFTIVNKGTTYHGASIHAAYTQTSKYLGKIEAGKSKSLLFKVTYPGVYMYHCAPGGHAIPMHVIYGQYGMIVVKPKKKYKLETILNKPPDVEIFLNQHEFYSSGKDAIEGKPLYTAFNGKLFRYVENPIKAKPGDYVRIYYLNVGPNQSATFHIVGIIWDFAYWQGNPDMVYTGGQSVLAGPTDSWVIEFRVPPDEGSYLMLNHAVGPTDRGAIGLLVCDDSAQTPVTVIGDGPKYSQEEISMLKTKVTRVISPFEPGSIDVDPVAYYGPETGEVTVKIIGNSFYPKSIVIAEGTKVKWVNEDVFSYMEGEFAGIHTVTSYEGGPEPFSSNLLAHTESFTSTFNKEGDYKYMCTPHPYMKGTVSVKDMGGRSTAGPSKIGLGFLITLLFLVTFQLAVTVYNGKRKK